MPSDFFFAQPTFNIPPLKAAALSRWQHLQAPDVQYVIAAEEQYLSFHLHMLSSLRHTQVGQIACPPYAYELGLSVRAGAVKAAVLVAASILEAALRALAEKRGYPLNKDPRRRTFGNVIKAWEVEDNPRPDVASVWSQVLAVYEVRNYVHLHKAAGAGDGDAGWKGVLAGEEALLAGARKAIDHVAQIMA